VLRPVHNEFHLAKLLQIVAPRTHVHNCLAVPKELFVCLFVCLTKTRRYNTRITKQNNSKWPPNLLGESCDAFAHHHDGAFGRALLRLLHLFAVCLDDVEPNSLVFRKKHEQTVYTQVVLMVEQPAKKKRGCAWGDFGGGCFLLKKKKVRKNTKTGGVVHVLDEKVERPTRDATGPAKYIDVHCKDGELWGETRQHTMQSVH
jgi:hypothetical protein